MIAQDVENRKWLHLSWPSENQKKVKIFNDFLEKLAERMARFRRDNDICKVTKEALKVWKRRTGAPMDEHRPLHIAEALHDQETLGWQAYFGDSISIKWQEIQHQY